uniref:RNA helicase n=1 Tax=Panagrellus redivivus TaxID=6233 RepID=A0A7E4VNK8_PANRE
MGKKKMLTAEQKADLLLPVTSVSNAAAKYRVFAYINEYTEKVECKRPVSTGVEIEDSWERQDGTLFVQMFLDNNEARSRINQRTSLALVQRKVPDHWGVVTEIDQLLITVRIGSHFELKDSYYRNAFNLELTENRKGYTNQYDAISKVEKYESLHDKLMYTVPDVDFDLAAFNKLSISEPTITATPSEKPLVKLNPEQERAVQEITKDTDTTFVLFGPPGTGKTSTLVEAIAKLVKSGAKILICTPTNNSANVIAEALVDRGLKDSIFRILAASVDRFDLSEKLKSVTVRPVFDEDTKRIYYPMPEKLNEYPIIVTTLDSAWRVKSLVDYVFTHIFVDEAGQVPEMNIWKPFADFGATSRLILAGDPKQLGPFTKASMLADPQFCYNDSMVARLANNPDIKTDLRFLIILTKNYRSHKAIVDSFSNIFYDGIIEDTQPEGHASLCKYQALPNVGFPVVFHSIKGDVFRGRKRWSRSSQNQPEAELVVQYIQDLVANQGVNEQDIGVVSFYRSQTDLLHQMLGRQSKVTVDSIERFQGGEKRVIIITCVRNGKNLGFLKNPARLNTAISRAKQLLIMIGHADSLDTLPDWKKFIDYCRENNAFKQGNFI